MGARAPSWPAFVGRRARWRSPSPRSPPCPPGRPTEPRRTSCRRWPPSRVVSIAVVVWRIDPAYTLSAAIFLSPLAGNWPQLGVPGPLSPDRLLLAGGIAAVLLRAPPVADRPRLQISGAHWVLALAVDLCARIRLPRRHALAPRPVLQARRRVRHHAVPDLPGRAGGLPDAAPAPCPARHARGARRLPGAHRALRDDEAGRARLPEVHPRPQLRHPCQRGRGPFVDAVANGLALYTCAVACAIAFASWRARRCCARSRRRSASCAWSASFLSLERSVWIGVVLGTGVAMLATRGLRRYLVPVVAAAAAAIAVSLALIPGPVDQCHRSAPTTSRPSGTARTSPGRPSTWSRPSPSSASAGAASRATSRDYFQQAFDYPLTATEAGVHNTPLTYAVDLGLVGMTLWLVGVVCGIGAALTTRGPPDLRPLARRARWRSRWPTSWC